VHLGPGLSNRVTQCRDAHSEVVTSYRARQLNSKRSPASLGTTKLECRSVPDGTNAHSMLMIIALTPISNKGCKQVAFGRESAFGIAVRQFPAFRGSHGSRSSRKLRR